MPNSRRMEDVNCDWSTIIRIRLARHRVMRHPRSQSASPQSVVAYFSFISRAALSDSEFVSEAMIMSSMLVADMEKPDEVEQVYTHQSDSQCLKPIAV
jgi:hypothetical protein